MVAAPPECRLRVMSRSADIRFSPESGCRYAFMSTRPEEGSKVKRFHRSALPRRQDCTSVPKNGVRAPAAPPCHLSSQFLPSCAGDQTLVYQLARWRRSRFALGKIFGARAGVCHLVTLPPSKVIRHPDPIILGRVCRLIRSSPPSAQHRITASWLALTMVAQCSTPAGSDHAGFTPGASPARLPLHGSQRPIRRPKF
jgi:hypothetical protein